MVFQDPMTSLNPLHTVGRQMDEMLRLHTDLDAPARKAACVEMLESVGISRAAERLDAYPHQFSGGMRQRVVIAIALLAGPRLIIADEPTTALDVTIQSQILKLMRRQIADRGASMILITHDLAVVSEMADQITVLYCGKRGGAGADAGRDRRPGPSLYARVDRQHSRSASPADPPEPDPRHRARYPQSARRMQLSRALPACPGVVRQVDPPLTAQRASLHAACHFPLTEAEAP